jgi:hypothetical protein
MHTAIPDATGDSTNIPLDWNINGALIDHHKRLADLEHDNNVLRAQIGDILGAFSTIRREFELMTEKNIKLVKKVNEFLDRWTVA